MTTAAVQRVAELVREHALDADSAQRLGALVELIATDPHAPTAVSAPERAVDVHIADSLSALALAEVRAARRIADIGSGAGPVDVIDLEALRRARSRAGDGLS